MNGTNKKLITKGANPITYIALGEKSDKVPGLKDIAISETVKATRVFIWKRLSSQKIESAIPTIITKSENAQTICGLNIHPNIIFINAI